MEWRPEELETGVETFDEHHQKLVDLINDLHSAMKTGEAKDHLNDILKELQDYTEYHFDAEEKAMKKHGYDGLNEQERQHDGFVEKIDEFQQDFEQGNITLTMDIMNFLKDWLNDHIKGTDAEYGEFFQGKNV